MKEFIQQVLLSKSVIYYGIYNYHNIIGMLPIEVDMNQIPQLDLQEEEEPPPPLPERSANLYTDDPSQGSKPGAVAPRVPPALNNEVPPPALPPKPAHMKLVGMRLSLHCYYSFCYAGLLILWRETSRF